MNTREKFRYMAFGGALVFLGMVGAMMSPFLMSVPIILNYKFGAVLSVRVFAGNYMFLFLRHHGTIT